MVFKKSSSAPSKTHLSLTMNLYFHDIAGYKMSSVSNYSKWHSFPPNILRAVTKDQRGAFLTPKPAPNKLNLLTKIQVIKIQ